MQFAFPLEFLVFNWYGETFLPLVSRSKLALTLHGGIVNRCGQADKDITCCVFGKLASLLPCGRPQFYLDHLLMTLRMPHPLAFECDFEAVQEYISPEFMIVIYTSRMQSFWCPLNTYRWSITCLLVAIATAKRSTLSEDGLLLL